MSEKTVLSATYTNSSCGDKVALTGILAHDIITELQFEFTGCQLCQRAAQVLVKHVLNTHKTRACSVTEQDIQTWLGLELGPVRISCALTPLLALRQALECSKVT